MTTAVTVGTPLAEALGNVIQPKLVEMGWSSEGGDDSALTEYVILMLVNGKSQEQIAGELSNDLLGLGEGDTQALDFSRWLFDQVEILNQQVNGGGPLPSNQSASGQAIPSFSDMDTSSPATGNDGAQDTEMGDSGVTSDGMYVFHFFPWVVIELIEIIALQGRRQCATTDLLDGVGCSTK